MPGPIVLSHFQAEPLRAARRAGKQTIRLSPDLGLSSVTVTLMPEGVRFPTDQHLTWSTVDQIAKSENSCFGIEGETARKIQIFSEETNRLYTLYPTPGAPTMLVSGIPMHRIKGTDPHHDTLAKVGTVAPILGRALDTATGLGYTAIEAARTADLVITVELDPAATEVARLNPWSRDLFDNPKIERRISDSLYEIATFSEGYFSCIIHDPPMFNLAGELYSLDFYRETHRVLARGGKLFHYIGDLESKSGGGVARGVIDRLKQAGFRRIEKRPEAFGVVAFG